MTLLASPEICRCVTSKTSFEAFHHARAIKFLSSSSTTSEFRKVGVKVVVAIMRPISPQPLRRRSTKNRHPEMTLRQLTSALRSCQRTCWPSNASLLFRVKNRHSHQLRLLPVPEKNVSLINLLSASSSESTLYRFVDPHKPKETLVARIRIGTSV